MHDSAIENAKKEIDAYLKTKYDDIKFTIKYNGELFIAAAQIKELKRIKSGGLPDCVSCFGYNSNKIEFSLSESWLEKSVMEIKEAKYSGGQIMIYSQIKRLEKQIEFGLYGGLWCDEMYVLARNILYFLHTKSESIRTNIVKKAASDYNKLQIKGQIPKQLIIGYKNALTQISDR